MKKAVSLIELLLALALLSIVAAVIIPKFLNVQDRANEVVSQQLASQLNRTFAAWVSSGGSVGSTAATSDLLYVLGGLGSSAGSGSGAVADSSTSSAIKVTLPTAITESLEALRSSGASSTVVSAADRVIIYSNGTGQFIAASQPGEIPLGRPAGRIYLTAEPLYNLAMASDLGSSPFLASRAGAGIVFSSNGSTVTGYSLDEGHLYISMTGTAAGTITNCVGPHYDETWGGNVYEVTGTGLGGEDLGTIRSTRAYTVGEKAYDLRFYAPPSTPEDMMLIL